LSSSNRFHISMPLDLQAREFLDKLQRSRAPAMHTLSPEDARALVVPLRMPREPVDRIENRVIDGPAGELRVRIYHPSAASGGTAGASQQTGRGRPVVVYFHGGGWVVGSIASHDALCRRLCNQSAGIVVSVDYRLAPEHRFPAAVDDCFAATLWVADHAAEWGGDLRRLAVAGDSAGGNLAAVVALLARDRGGPAITRQVLIYPITDYMPDFESYQRNGRDYFLTTETIAWFWEQYLNDPEQGRDWRTSPIRAADLTGLPPAVVLVAEYDPLIDEGLAYADRLEAAGVEVSRIVCPGQIHGFIRRLDIFDCAANAVEQLSDDLRSAFGLAGRESRS
jgi:acetyl esterase